MEFSALTSLLWSTSVFGAALDRRQLPGLFPKPASPNKITDLPPRIRTNAERKIVRWGPYTIPGVKTKNKNGLFSFSMDPDGFVIANTLYDGICKDCAVLAGKTDITFDDESRADVKDGVYLHHILMLDQSKTLPDFISYYPAKFESFFANLVANPLGSTFLGAAVNEFMVWYAKPLRDGVIPPEDVKATNGTTDSGYYMKDDKIILQAEVVNYRKAPQKVYVSIDYEYLPGRIGVDSLSTLNSVTGCGAAIWKSNDKKQMIQSEGFPVMADGTIINARGHMHDGGTKMLLYHNDRQVCISNATYGGEGLEGIMAGKKWESISEMTGCNEPIKVRKGDYIKIESQYDTEMHPP